MTAESGYQAHTGSVGPTARTTEPCIATTRSSTARALSNTGLRLLGHTGFPNKLATAFAELNYR
ncbi:hypothetical protein ABZT28_56230 [Streptomyces sp. NPDC005388]|uniref:hypothetical protein n=1 Tax=Streptomyces sp. NPDC005388 TaxID=3156717 RepID=UPI0033BF61D7